MVFLNEITEFRSSLHPLEVKGDKDVKMFYEAA